MIKDSNKKKIWKKITKIGFRNTNETIKYLKKKKFVIKL